MLVHDLPRYQCGRGGRMWSPGNKLRMFANRRSWKMGWGHISQKSNMRPCRFCTWEKITWRDSMETLLFTGVAAVRGGMGECDIPETSFRQKGSYILHMGVVSYLAKVDSCNCAVRVHVNYTRSVWNSNCLSSPFPPHPMPPPSMAGRGVPVWSSANKFQKVR